MKVVLLAIIKGGSDVHSVVYEDALKGSLRDYKINCGAKLPRVFVAIGEESEVTCLKCLENMKKA